MSQGQIPILTGNTNDDTYAISAGTGQKLTTAGLPAGATTGNVLVGSTAANTPPSSSIVDGFTRPGENPLSDGGNWTTFTGYLGNPMAILTTGQATSSASATICADVWTATQSADAEIWTTVAALGGSDFINLFLRIGATSSGNCYRVKVQPTAITVFNNNGGTQLATGTVTINVGDGILARVHGTTIEAWHQPGGTGAWTQVFTISDSTYATGYCGIATSSQTAAVGPVAVGAVSESVVGTWEDPYAGSNLQVFVKDGDIYLDVLKNGVAAGGSTDQSVAFQAAHASAISQGKVLKIPAAEYVLNTAKYVTGTPRVDADGAIFLCGHASDAIWNFSGDTIESAISSAAGQHSYTAMVNLTANAAVNTDSAADQVINAPTSGSGWSMSQGDVVMIGDLSTLVGGSSATNTSAALNMYEVKAVVSSSQFTITEPLVYAMTTANSAYVLVNKGLNAATGAWGGFWHGGTFIGTQSYTSTDTASALRFWSLRDFELVTKAQELTSFAFNSVDCWSIRGAVDLSDLADVQAGGQTGQYGYGFAWGGATANSRMSVIAKRVRHGSAFVGTGHNCWADVVATGTTSTAADAHAGFTNSGYTNVEADGCPVAVTMRGKGYRIGSVNAKNCGMGLYVLDVPGDVVIDRLNVENTIPQDSTADPTGATGHAVRVDQSLDRLVIGGGRWQDIQGHGVYLNLSETVSDLVITGVTAQNLYGNSHSSNLGYLVYMTSSAGITRGRIANNVVDDNQGTPSTTAVIYAGSSSITDVQLKNNLLANGVVAAAGANQGLVTNDDVSVFTPTVTAITTTGSYSPPAGATKLTVTCIGGGGGAGSGPMIASGTIAYGGGASTNGSMAQIRLPVSEISAPVTCTIGAAGTPGVTVTTNSTNGNAGTGGGNTHFGSYLWAYGGSPGGAGGTTAPSAAAITTGMYPTNTGAAGGNPNGNGANSGVGGGAGGAGGGISTGGTAGTGGNAAQSSTFQGGTAGTGGAIGTAGNNGAAAPVAWYPGVAGGGGGAALSGQAGAGGNGAGYGAGAGGGGAALNGSTGSGAGGTPTAGAIVIYAE